MIYQYDDTSLPRIVIIGGGFAGLELVKKLNNQPYRVTLLDKNNFHTFQPLLYQIASAGLTAESIAYPFRRKIGKFPNVIFRLATVDQIDTETQKVHTDVGEFEYDHLIIASGAITNFYGNTAIEKVSFTLKSVQEALAMRSAILHKFERAIISDSMEAQKQRMNFIIVGGGPTGVELAGALAEIRKNVLPHDYRELKGENMEIHLIEGSGRLLATMSEKSSQLAKKYLEEDKVHVWLNTLVQNFDCDELVLSNGEKIKTDNIIWAAGVKGATIPGININSIVKGGKYSTDAYNRIQNYSNVYAIGDICYMTEDKNYPNGHPGVAQVALQQAVNLSNNLIRLTKNQNLKPFKYKNKGNMATIGRHKAVVDLPFYSFGGYLAWYIWMFIHLMALVGFRNRFMVFINWMWNYISYDRALRIIVEPEEKNI